MTEDLWERGSGVAAREGERKRASERERGRRVGERATVRCSMCNKMDATDTRNTTNARTRNGIETRLMHVQDMAYTNAR